MKLITLIAVTLLTLSFIVSCSEPVVPVSVDDSVPSTLAKPEKGELVSEVEGILPDYSIADLISNSELIVTGTVTKILPTEKGKRPSGKLEFLYTDVIITIDTCLYGDKDLKEVLVRVWGGEFENLNEIYNCEPIFRLNESTLVFLAEFSEVISVTEETSAPYYRVTGSLLGKFSLDDNSAIQQKTGQKYTIEQIQNKIDKVTP